MSTTPSPNEAQIFDAVWGFVAELALANADTPPASSAQIIKGYQNRTAPPQGNYCILRPGEKERFDQARMVVVDGPGGTNPGTVTYQRNTDYRYVVDCYGAAAPDWADAITILWRTPSACDKLAAALPAGTMQPLYADEPQQITIVNEEYAYETRWRCTLHLNVIQTARVPQDFFDKASITVTSPGDLL
ncbi:hypothetical protein T2_00017 [Ralstonia phage Elie]|uniref:Tail completion protein 1 n=4 Tax=Bakolyvirus TaxID=2843355 RepID=A0A7G5BBP6_9CAUD|nr:tail completion protein 1 [Ralstonia phage Adzire]YP_010052790.1 tail completion protein 1 [Ralstonia phage Bakoly]YP_010077704.1 tail completion protein 1 [Ralstonia phage Simangalove]QMV32962.1 hypothetical protein T2_00017 [Ralstonia phage Elie]QMV33529.1 tail completion protein 1 [Ralstonia phage Jenny]QMV33674.1 hypothetical protein S3_00030 [Ralstonia phage Sarlave]QMV32334.1 tail completion protein 1 [Ralstonia phage Adzire]QMV32614.1 tail completion protein 1 [Ralstonia phage Bako